MKHKQKAALKLAKKLHFDFVELSDKKYKDYTIFLPYRNDGIIPCYGYPMYIFVDESNVAKWGTSIFDDPDDLFDL